ncbi:DUF6916 family protein [Kordiimonas marina]|uniref:DUF6916 family protein n=1 Tax=Kordiimonas marina TaxID=2872312 RepID=UPI001FF50E8D|nr:hypothetical protein [Kordiimonas marina]MCJ9429435.1 hypothetical protein [Kordiimonas marina]
MTEGNWVANVTAERFEERLKSMFQLVSGEVTMDVQLVRCKLNPDGEGPDSVRTPFSLVFRADEDAAHPMQQTKEFTGALHGLELGTLSGLYICRTLRPVRTPPGAYYQVAFN